MLTYVFANCIERCKSLEHEWNVNVSINDLFPFFLLFSHSGSYNPEKAYSVVKNYCQIKKEINMVYKLITIRYMKYYEMLQLYQ